MKYLHKFLHFTKRERHLLVSAVLLLSAIWLGLWLLVSNLKPPFTKDNTENYCVA